MNVRPVNENDFQQTVIEHAHARGWIVAHFRSIRKPDGTYETPVQADGKGFPDLFLLRPTTGHRVAAELKVGHNKPTDDQNRWLDAMEDCQIPAFVWKPSDWTEIEAVLTHGAKPIPREANNKGTDK